MRSKRDFCSNRYLFFSFLGVFMVCWLPSFKIPTKKASSFLSAARRLIKEKCGIEWQVSSKVGQRITEITFYEPTFGYRVDLQTPWETIRKAEQEFNKVMNETRIALLKLADSYGATVLVITAYKNKYVEPKKLLEAMAEEDKAVKVLADALQKVKPSIEMFTDILTVDSIFEKAKKRSKLY